MASLNSSDESAEDIDEDTEGDKFDLADEEEKENIDNSRPQRMRNPRAKKQKARSLEVEAFIILRCPTVEMQRSTASRPQLACCESDYGKLDVFPAWRRYGRTTPCPFVPLP